MHSTLQIAHAVYGQVYRRKGLFRFRPRSQDLKINGIAQEETVDNYGRPLTVWQTSRIQPKAISGRLS